MKSKSKKSPTQTNTKKKRIFVVTGKGGSGKSVTSTAVSCALNMLGISHTDIDLDLSNATFHRTAGAHLIGCKTIGAIGSTLEKGPLETFVHNQVQALVLDFGHGSIDEFRRMCRKNDFVSVMTDCGIETIVMHVLDHSLDGITNLIETTEAAPSAIHIVVFNYGLAKSESPQIEYRSVTENFEFQQITKGMQTIVLREQEDLVDLDAQGLLLSEIGISTHPLTRNPLLMHRVKKWIELFTGDLDERLGLSVEKNK